MSRRAVLWIAFAVVHLLVAWLGFVLPNQPMGDLYFVYEPWARDAMSGEGIVGIHSDWIYPQVAIVPIVLANMLEWIAGYEVAWAILVIVCDALAFQLLVGRGRSRGRVAAAWFWLGFTVLLGPVGMYRLDAVTVPLAIAGCLWLVGRPWLASVLLAVATWIKVWPAALILAALVVVRRRLAVLAGALVTSAAVLVAVVAAGGGAHALGFVAGQTDRGLQLEAPVSAVYLWMAIAGAPDSFVYYDRDILTFQVSGPGVDAVIALMTPLLASVLAATVAVGAVKAWRGASFVRLFPMLALCLVLAFIVFNKVGSPQYLVWLIPPIAIGIVVDRRRWALLAAAGLAAALLTFLVYPLTYGSLLAGDPWAAAILTVRNLVLIAMLAGALVLLAQVPQRTRHPIDARVAP